MALTLVIPLANQPASAKDSVDHANNTFRDNGDILARASKIEDIEYKIMVQRATQTAIWAMPAAAMMDFINATRRDAGGD